MNLPRVAKKQHDKSTGNHLVPGAFVIHFLSKFRFQIETRDA